MKKSKFTDKLASFIKNDITRKGSSFYMDTNKELSVFRCRSLLDYNSNSIKILLTDSIIDINGEDLKMRTFANTEITVYGSIKNICIEEANE